ncbi:MAG: putative membrane protein [Microgenomates group bacterium Gr01-1014_7]|nr:MAG: putative membrane protein [Microgenomates group bacterium Gr01-1014_7]
MKTLLRYFLINLTSLVVATQLIPGLSYTGGIKSLIIGAFFFMLINFILVPLLKILFLPLNLLTVGLFSWVVNVLALYVLTTISSFVLLPYRFPGANLWVLSIPAMDLTTFWVAVAASVLIGIIAHFLQWLVH